MRGKCPLLTESAPHESARLAAGLCVNELRRHLPRSLCQPLSRLSPKVLSIVQASLFCQSSYMKAFQHCFSHFRSQDRRVQLAPVAATVEERPEHREAYGEPHRETGARMHARPTRRTEAIFSCISKMFVQFPNPRVSSFRTAADPDHTARAVSDRCAARTLCILRTGLHALRCRLCPPMEPKS